MAKETTEPTAPERAGNKLTWWQWVLMYPTLAVALMGAVPQFTQWVSALRMGGSLNSNVADLEAQHRAWTRNANCLEQIKRVKPTSETAYAIDLLVCPSSGDILITLRSVQNPTMQTSRWIMTRELFAPGTQLALISSAHAQQPAQREEAVHATRVIGVKSGGDVIVRRVQLSNNTCEDQMIKSYTGRLIGTKRAPCEPL